MQLVKYLGTEEIIRQNNCSFPTFIRLQFCLSASTKTYLQTKGWDNQEMVRSILLFGCRTFPSTNRWHREAGGLCYWQWWTIGQLTTWSTTLNDGLENVLKPWAVGCARWRKDWPEVSSEFTLFRLTWGRLHPRRGQYYERRTNNPIWLNPGTSASE